MADSSPEAEILGEMYREYFVCTEVNISSTCGSSLSSGVSNNLLCGPTDDSLKSSESIGECDLKDTITASRCKGGSDGDDNYCNSLIKGLMLTDCSFMHWKIFTTIHSKTKDNTPENAQKQSINFS